MIRLKEQGFFNRSFMPVAQRLQVMERRGLPYGTIFWRKHPETGIWADAPAKAAFRLTEEEMQRIESLDDGESLFFSHYDPKTVEGIVSLA